MSLLPGLIKTRLQIVVVRSGEKFATLAVDVRAEPDDGRGRFAGKRVAELAGRLVTVLVHGAIVDGHVGPTVRQRVGRPGRRQRVPRPETVAGLRHGRHAGVGGRPAAGGGRPRRFPRADGVRPVRAECVGRGGERGHPTPDAAAATAVVVVGTAAVSEVDDRVGRPVPDDLRHAVRHVVVSVRRDHLHGLLAAVADLVLARQRGRQTPATRPLRVAGPLRGRGVDPLAVPGDRPKVLLRHHRRPLRQRLGRFVRLSARTQDF